MTEPGQEYREKYLEEKFKGINDKLDTIIDNAKDETMKRHELDRRVRDIEKVQMICPVNTIVDSFEKHKAQNKDEIEKLKKTTEDLDYYKRNPAQLRYLMIGAGLSIILSLAIALFSIYNLYKQSNP